MVVFGYYYVLILSIITKTWQLCTGRAISSLFLLRRQHLELHGIKLHMQMNCVANETFVLFLKAIVMLIKMEAAHSNSDTIGYCEVALVGLFLSKYSLLKMH